MTKILALSDLHGSRLDVFDFGDIDLCLIAGDIAPLSCINRWEKTRQERWVKNEFCSFMASKPKTEFVFVAGNHDFWGEKYTGRESFWPDNAHYLKNSSVSIFNHHDRLNIWGSPLVNPVGNIQRWAFESSDVVQNAAFADIPKNTDILLTHTPPLLSEYFIDVPLGACEQGSSKPLHLGSTALTDAIDRVRPKFLFCGHIHSGNHHEIEYGYTRCFNVSVLDEHYHVSFYPLAMVV